MNGSARAALRRFRTQLIAGALLALCAVTLVDQLARQRGQQQAVANAQHHAALEVLAGHRSRWLMCVHSMTHSSHGRQR